MSRDLRPQCHDRNRDITPLLRREVPERPAPLSIVGLLTTLVESARWCVAGVGAAVGGKISKLLPNCFQ